MHTYMYPVQAPGYPSLIILIFERVSEESIVIGLLWFRDLRDLYVNLKCNYSVAV